MQAHGGDLCVCPKNYGLFPLQRHQQLSASFCFHTRVLLIEKPSAPLLEDGESVRDSVGSVGGFPSLRSPLPRDALSIWGSDAVVMIYEGALWPCTYTYSPSP
jgi:hypothetical protein